MGKKKKTYWLSEEALALVEQAMAESGESAARIVERCIMANIPVIRAAEEARGSILRSSVSYAKIVRAAQDHELLLNETAAKPSAGKSGPGPAAPGDSTNPASLRTPDPSKKEAS